MKIYLYDANSFEYLKETYAIIDIEESKKQGKHIYAIPSNATTLQPPKPKDNECCFFEQDKWVIKPDYRGKKFFDPVLNHTVVVDYIGNIPEHYIPMSSTQLINYINNVDYEKLYNSVKGRVDKLVELKLKNPILIGKYYHNPTDLDKYIQFFNTTTEQIRGIQKTIIALENAISKQTDIEKINELKIQQLDKYNEIESFKFNILVKNKRNKEVEVILTYDEFKDIINTIQEYVKEVGFYHKNNLIKINKLSNYELVLFEQRLIKEESSYGDTEIKENS